MGSLGISALCKDVGVDADNDVVVLIFAQKCEASRMGFFSLEEFDNGMRALKYALSNVFHCCVYCDICVRFCRAYV